MSASSESVPLDEEVPMVRAKVWQPGMYRHKHLDRKPDKGTFRILMASDNHLGYAENDAIRKNDSFESFEEILQIAKDNRVDMVLLGGDLFHDNKPSRNSMFKATELFRKYCFGSNPVSYQIVSDQKMNFPTGIVNYEDPNFNIDLPVFTIHGNHDDPAGMGSHSSIDVLSTCNLVNYFGKTAQVDDITLYPILLRKGNTKIALYGLGNIRDERLHRTFKANMVKWVRPVTDQDEWFSIAVVHQNRHKHSARQKNFIRESMLPSFLDVVLWGHEHECLIDPVESETGDFNVIQPGSSVATSLSAGEAVKKRVGLFEVRALEGQMAESRLVSMSLRTVRPFCMQDIKLADHLDATRPKVADIEAFLSDRVTRLAEQAKIDSKSDMLPLVRLRVDITLFPRINTSRFGQQFVGVVANPEEILLFTKTRDPTKKRNKQSMEGLEGIKLGDFADNNNLGPKPIHMMVKKTMSASNTPLTILSPDAFADIVQDACDKKDYKMIDKFINQSLKTLAKQLLTTEIADESHIAAAISNMRGKQQLDQTGAKIAHELQEGKMTGKRKTAAAASKKKKKVIAPKKKKGRGKKVMVSSSEEEDVSSDSESSEEVVKKPRARRKAANSTKHTDKKQKVTATKTIDLGSDSASEFSDEPAPAKRTVSRAKRKAPAKKKITRAELEAELLASGSDFVESSEDDAVIQRRSTKRKQPPAKAKAKPRAKKAAPAKKRKTQAKLLFSQPSDLTDLVDDDDDDWGETAKTPRASRSRKR